MDKEVLFAGEFIIGAETSTLQAQQICDFLEKYLYNGNIAPQLGFPRDKETFLLSAFTAIKHKKAIVCYQPTERERGLAGALLYCPTGRTFDGGKTISSGIHISDFAVASELASTPERKGRGIGRAIMTYLEAEALSQNRTFISLSPSETSIPFYNRLDFSPVPLSGHSYDYSMIKHLHPQQ